MIALAKARRRRAGADAVVLQPRDERCTCWASRRGRCRATRRRASCPTPRTPRALIDGQGARHRAGDAEQPDRRGLPARMSIAAPSRNCAGGTGSALVLDETYRDFLPAEGDAPHALVRRPGMARHRDRPLQLFQVLLRARPPARRDHGGRTCYREIAQGRWTASRSARRGRGRRRSSGPSTRLRTGARKTGRRSRRAPPLSRLPWLHAPAGGSNSMGAYFAYLAIPSKAFRRRRSPSCSPSSAACSACPASISARARKGTCASPSRTPTARPSRSFLTGSRVSRPSASPAAARPEERGLTKARRRAQTTLMLLGSQSTLGYLGSMSSSVLRTMEAMSAFRAHLWLAGMMCHGAQSVEQRSTMVW